MHGDPSQWPGGSVQMNKQVPVLIVPWSIHYENSALADVWKGLRKSQSNSTGIILVGDVPKDHPTVQALFQAMKGNMVYLDAGGSGFRLQKAETALVGLPTMIGGEEISSSEGLTRTTRSTPSRQWRTGAASEFTCRVGVGNR